MEAADFRYNQERARIHSAEMRDANPPVRVVKTPEIWQGDRLSRLNGYSDRRPVNPNQPKNRRLPPP
ncbi:hypothetical protein NG799_09930 [Laspinema sp. D1]|uniref:Uncharacterized protein n=1 Tax=Laspinema palackyanum D2a TaxID=2953684 RepID=A0ABT2MPH4_9CYAN|nr:hypothetical protein [Laspinema sp. D2b]MCT7966649.1 hypothetical protein [Laspinema sp. D2a]